jgi:hypothetical protein
VSDDIVEIIEIGLILRLVENGGMEVEKATKLVGTYFEDFREGYGGVRHMVRRGYRRYPPALIRKIKRQYTGRNEKELRELYGMSRTTFYRQIKK